MLSYFIISEPNFIFTDAHQPVLSEMLAQIYDKINAKPLDFASLQTRQKSYMQLDLKAIAFDFALRRFRLYLVGTLNDVIIVTDNHPKLSLFNKKRNVLLGLSILNSDIRI